MSMTFTKLFASITESTVWCEPDRTRLVWVCMLAMADRKGRVFASIPGLANRSRVPLEDAVKAIDTFLSPDAYSRTPDFEGRRIEPIDGGWRLLNHEKYRTIRDEEITKEHKRNYINNRRAAEREESKKNSTVERSRDNAEAEAEAEADTEKKSNTARKRALDCPEGVSQEIFEDWKAQRKAKKSSVSKTVIEGIAREAGIAGLTLEQAMTIQIERGWQGFKAEWLHSSGGGNPNKQEALEARNRKIADDWLRDKQHTNFV